MLRVAQRVRPPIASRKIPQGVWYSGHGAPSTADATAATAEWESAKPYSEIPGPRALPLVGAMHEFLPGGKFYKKDTASFFDAIHKMFGPVARLSGVFGKPEIVFVSNADEVARVFRSEGPWPIRRGNDCLDYYYRNLRKDYPPSLVVSQGKEWQEFRTSVNQVMMQPRNTKQYVEPIDRVSQNEGYSKSQF